MWSLPDIKRMNAEAEERALAKKAAAAETVDYERLHLAEQGDLFTGEFAPMPEVSPYESCKTCGGSGRDDVLVCERCDGTGIDPDLSEDFDGEICEYCDDPATMELEYYDIFSDDPKGELHLCENHYEDGIYSDDYFECDTCGRFMITNYTWEQYYTVGDGYMQCLKCAFEEFISEPTNSITKENVDDILSDIEERRLEALGEMCPHLIAVGADYYVNYIDFYSNHEFTQWESDGVCPGSTWEEFFKDIRDAVETHETVYLILDAAYQFSVSIGIYTRRPNEKTTQTV